MENTDWREVDFLLAFINCITRSECSRIPEWLREGDSDVRVFLSSRVAVRPSTLYLKQYLACSGARISKTNCLQKQQLKNSGVHQSDFLVISLIWIGKWPPRSNAGHGSTYNLTHSYFSGDLLLVFAIFQMNYKGAYL